MNQINNEQLESSSSDEQNHPKYPLIRNFSGFDSKKNKRNYQSQLNLQCDNLSNYYNNPDAFFKFSNQIGQPSLQDPRLQ